MWSDLGGRPMWRERMDRKDFEDSLHHAMVFASGTQEEFVRESGLALLWYIIECWLWGVLFAGITAAIWAPQLLQGRNIVLFRFGTGIGQLCVYAMAIWHLKRGIVANSVWFAFAASCLYICLASLMVR